MILYFSGTGNSRYVAKKIGELTGDKVLDLFSRIREEDYSKMESHSPWVVVAPVYAWRLPRFIENYLKKVSLEGSRKIYFILTCGDQIGGAGKYAEKLCAEIGMKFMGCQQVVMPENYIALFKAPEIDESIEIIKGAEEPISRLAKIVNQQGRFPKKKGGFVLSSIINNFFYVFGISDRKFWVKESCNSCGYCESLCPLNNISMEEGRPSWSGSCTHCMRCICSCPSKAIEWGKSTAKKVRYLCPPEEKIR